MSWKSKSSYRGGGGGGGGFAGEKRKQRSDYARRRAQTSGPSAPDDTGRKLDQMRDVAERDDALELEFGFARADDSRKRLGFLINLQPTLTEDSESGVKKSAVDLYFLSELGDTFKATLTFMPYFYVGVAEPNESTLPEVESYLRRRFEQGIARLDAVWKEDMLLLNHLSGLKRRYLKLSFHTIQALMAVRADLLPLVAANRRRRADGLVTADAGAADFGVGASGVDGGVVDIEDFAFDHVDGAGGGGANNTGAQAADGGGGAVRDAGDLIVDIREYDVPYYMRVAIDLDIRCGKWFEVQLEPGGELAVTARADLLERPDMRICAFDIECTKEPLRFPDANIDHVMMISYMLDTDGYLIVNRDIVSEDIADFEYTPKPEYEGRFHVFNEKDERATLERFFSEMRAKRPHIYVTFNGDFFDWPFIEARARAHGLSLGEQLGVRENQGEYRGRFVAHMDAFQWVVRDSYLPQGSQGLKAVTRKKLGYDPLELDPEEMLPFASEKPQLLASYSVSDAVATYYLYMKYVHPFIFSLCNIIPMNPDDVLRKGSGTLCEALLMVEATHANVIYPNKTRAEPGRTYKGHLLESETYVGGHVECLLSGVYRADVPMRFDLEPAAVQAFIDEAEQIVEFGAHEAGLARADVANFDAVVAQVRTQLADLRDAPRRSECPLIYHLDVAAMYPNIILTYRLQPTAIVTADTCAACDFNQPESNCQLKTHWTWRGDYIPATAAEVRQARNQLEVESFAPAPPELPWGAGRGRGGGGGGGGGGASNFGRGAQSSNASSSSAAAAAAGAANKARRSYLQLSLEERDEVLRKRLKAYSQTVYKKSHIEIEEERKATVCQRENSFYVDTVRAFRDRRYDYKREHKTWQSNLGAAKSLEEQIKARNMVIIYDSLQLAHKCILNSFYGYVMRRGARWYSMEMAGIVTHTGAQIIKMAKDMICKVGRPLELDTDGIWCVFPRTFPENFELQPRAGGKARLMSFPCAMLNRATEQHFANDQYQDLTPDGSYVAHRECSIAFEVDGPYRAMMLPASNKLGKGGATVKLKKRYAVFNSDRSLAELKGFELKRRGELKLIKIFQQEVFDKFLDGATLAECYASVGAVADKWLDVIDTRGRDVDDPVLLELITEASTMSKQLGEYGEQKSSRVTTAKRLADMLGESVVRDKGLNCSYVISRYPAGAPVSQRAIPVVVFKADEAVRREQLRKWLQSAAITDYSIRTILDWDYYRGRLVGVVQKLVTIPAFYQGLVNPVPRCVHPDWLLRDGSVNDTLQQQKLNFKVQSADERVAAAQRELARLQAEQPLAPRRAGVIGKGKKARFDPAQDDAELEGLDAPPSRAENYGLWIKWYKRQWRMQRRARHELRKQLGISDPAQAAAAASEAQKQQAAAAVAAASAGLPPKLALALRAHPQLVHDWHVVEIAPAFDVEWRGSGAQQQIHVVAAPEGDFTVWALVEGTLRALRVAVPRRFYVNSRANDAGHAAQSVRLHPPRGHVRHQLYEFSMPEADFVANKRSLSNYFSSELIEGVYETGTPLLTRALYEIGSVAHVLPEQRWHDHLDDNDDDDDDEDDAVGLAAVGALNQKAARDDATFVRELRLWRQRQRMSFSIDQLTAATKEPSLAAYLVGAERQLQRAFLYHADAGARGVLALVLPAPAGALRPVESATVLIVGAGNRDNARRAATQYARDSGLAGDAVTFAVVRNMDEAFARVNRLLVEREAKRRAALLPRRRGKKAQQLAAAFDVPPSSTLTIVQTALTPAQLRAQLPALHLTPVMPVAANDADARTLAAARALDAWELTAATLVYRRHELVAQQFEAQVRFARKTAVPLGNIAGDFLRLVSDVHLARALRTDACLLWYSVTDRPDLGGAEVDEFLYVDELVNPRVSVPGCYSGICVELDVIGMAINTMLEAPHILAEIGSTGALTFDGAEERPIDSAHAARAAFSTLRKLVTRWSIEVAHDDVFEPLLANFYRWIADTHSLAYDPALHRMVHSLMERVFWRLVERFRKADLTVVYADFNRMIVATKTQRAELAQHRVRTLLDAIKQDNLFAWLDLAPAASGAEYGSAWSTLIFYDSANYCGVPITASAHGGAATPLEQLEVRRNWNMATHLPATVAERFQAVVSSYALDVEKRRRASAASGGASKQRALMANDSEAAAAATLRESAPNGGAPESVLSRAMSLGKSSDDVTADGGDTLLHDAAFRTLLIRFVSDATSDASTDDKIEFVKAMCAVLSLDVEQRETVHLLKQMLLRPLGVTAFSLRAKFADPCRSLTLPDVVCAYCYDQRDFDLLRDAAAAAGVLECARCHHPYSRIALEARLVAQLQRRAVAYQLQDVRCTSCRLVAADLMRATCRACSKPLELRTPPDEMLDSLAVFGAVAKHHKFEWLASEVDALTSTD